MKLSEANALLEPGFLSLESGYTRLDDGQLHVAAWTTMPAVQFPSRGALRIGSPRPAVMGRQVAYRLLGSRLERT